MAILKFLSLTLRLNDLIRRKATGTPQELAEKLNVTERMVYHYIGELKSLGAPIYYDSVSKSYAYSKDFDIEDILKS